MDSAPPDTSYWSQDAVALAASFGTGPGGLSSARASSQLATIGPNSVEDAPRLSALRLLLRQFESPLVLILVFAAGISLALQQWVDAGIILAIVLGSSLLSFFQEYRASHGGRGTEETPRADGPRAAGRGGTGSAGDADRARATSSFCRRAT